MPSDVEVRPDEYPTDGITEWRFRNVADLEKALGKYHAFGDGTVVRRYGDTMPGGGDMWAGEAAADRLSLADESAQKRTLVRAFTKMSILAPLNYRLLDAYYRRPGTHGCLAASEEADGWVVALKYSCLVRNRQDHVSETTFRKLLEEAIHILLMCTMYRHVFRP